MQTLTLGMLTVHVDVCPTGKNVRPAAPMQLGPICEDRVRWPNTSPQVWAPDQRQRNVLQHRSILQNSVGATRSPRVFYGEPPVALFGFDIKDSKQ